MVSPRASASAAHPMAPSTPELKRPRQCDQAAALALQQNVTLPQVAEVVATLHANFARDEAYLTGVRDAVDHKAIILKTVLVRLELVEGQLATSGAVVTQLGVDAKANDDRLDAKPREEISAVTSLLDDGFRAEIVKTQPSSTSRALLSAPSRQHAAYQLGRRSRRVFPTSAALEASLAQLCGRASALSRHSPQPDYRFHHCARAAWRSHLRRRRAPDCDPRPAQRLLRECGRCGRSYRSSCWP